jgi:RNA recognition motif-containing protein
MDELAATGNFERFERLMDGLPTLGNLYIGDLAYDVNEPILRSIFSQVEGLAWVQVSRDPRTMQSRGFGFVSYWSEEAAQRAIDEFNYAQICGVPCRILWKDDWDNRDGASNLYVSSLDPAIDTYGLSRMFSVFGVVSSCKVETDQFGQSRGYGYVQFSNQESANKALSLCSGLTIGEKPIRIKKLIPIGERETENRLFVKHFPTTWSFEELETFLNNVVPIDDVELRSSWNGNVYALVLAKDDEDGATLTEKLNGVLLEGCDTPLMVAKATTWNDRWKTDDAVYLYIGNMETSVNNQQLENLCSPFGTVTSARIICHADGSSKGFGFVGYSTAAEASAAIDGLNNVEFMNQRLEVGLASKKDTWKKPASVPNYQREAFTAPDLDGGAEKAKGKGKGSQVWTVAEKQSVGNMLYSRILSVYPKRARKITGMILESSRAVATECVSNSKVLKARIEMCKALIDEFEGVEADEPAQVGSKLASLMATQASMGEVSQSQPVES